MRATTVSPDAARCRPLKRRHMSFSPAKQHMSMDFDVAAIFSFLVSACEAGPFSFTKAVRQEVDHLTLRCEERRNNSNYNAAQELVQLISILTELLEQHHHLTPSSIYQAHFFTGQLHQLLSNDEAAIRAYVKALWIATAARDTVPQLQLAITLHRLALCYGRRRNYEKASRLLSSVIAIYNRVQVPRKTEIFISAELLRREYTALYTVAEESQSSLGSLQKLLPMIAEGTESIDG